MAVSIRAGELMPSHWNDDAEREARSAVQRAFAREIKRITAIQNPFVAIVAILVLGMIAVAAIIYHVNGTLLLTLASMIAGIAGYAVHAIRRFGKDESDA